MQLSIVPQDQLTYDTRIVSATAFVFFTNVVTDRILRQVAAANAELAGQCDVHVIGYFPDAAAAPEPFRTNPRFHAYDRARMEAMGYPVKGQPFRLMPGNTDMPILAFMRDNPEYETIWLFENDVVFTGPLSSLTEAFAASEADLITTNIVPPPATWWYLSMNVVPENWPADLPRLRAFLPAFRASRRLLLAVDRFYKDGGNGHYEYSWTYVARACGFGLEDFGGRGEYVRPENRDRFYTSSPQMSRLYPGSFRFRPAMRRAGRQPMKLWHPVKEDNCKAPLANVLDHASLTLRWLLLPLMQWLPEHARRR